MSASHHCCWLLYAQASGATSMKDPAIGSPRPTALANAAMSKFWTGVVVLTTVWLLNPRGCSNKRKIYLDVANSANDEVKYVIQYLVPMCIGPSRRSRLPELAEGRGRVAQQARCVGSEVSTKEMSNLRTSWVLRGWCIWVNCSNNKGTLTVGVPQGESRGTSGCCTTCFLVDIILTRVKQNIQSRGNCWPAWIVIGSAPGSGNVTPRRALGLKVIERSSGICAKLIGKNIVNVLVTGLPTLALSKACSTVWIFVSWAMTARAIKDKNSSEKRIWVGSVHGWTQALNIVHAHRCETKLIFGLVLENLLNPHAPASTTTHFLLYKLSCHQKLEFDPDNWWSWCIEPGSILEHTETGRQTKQFYLILSRKNDNRIISLVLLSFMGYQD